MIKVAGNSINIFGRRTSTASSDSEGTANFDMLRARLEVDLPRPAVIAITSSTAEDGAATAARGLAHSLAEAGYPTLFIDASKAVKGKGNMSSDLTLEELANHTIPSADSRDLSTLNLCDVTLQKKTSQRDMQSTLGLFRTKFDYVIMSAQHGVSTSFATSIVAAADAVLVAVKTGRRQRALDERVAETLERLESRFIGVIALSASVANRESTLFRDTEVGKVSRRNPSSGVDKDLLLRDVAEFTT